MSKGQIWSYDIMISAMVFILALALISFFWWSITATMNAQPTPIFKESREFAGDVLSSGSPQSWDSVIDPGDPGTWSAATSIGLLESDAGLVVSGDKLVALREMDEADHSLLREKLGLGYEFQVLLHEFYDCSEPMMIASPYNCEDRGISPFDPEWSSRSHLVTVGGSGYSIGSAPDSSAKTVATIKRFAVYNDSLVRVTVLLWTSNAWQ